MDETPSWFKQLVWSPAWSVGALKQRKVFIPKAPGCYVLTCTPLEVRADHTAGIGQQGFSFSAIAAVAMPVRWLEKVRWPVVQGTGIWPLSRVGAGSPWLGCDRNVQG
jgi:hypothetical protein